MKNPCSSLMILLIQGFFRFAEFILSEAEGLSVGMTGERAQHDIIAPR